MNPYLNAIFESVKETINVTGVGETLAYTWFGRSNIIYSDEAKKYWVGTTKDTLNGTTQHITEYDLENDTYNTTQLGTAFEKDDHNQCQIIVRNSDKRLVAYYTEHIGSYIRCRVSTNPLDSSSWQGEIQLNPDGNFGYTYPSPYESSNGNVFVFYRNQATNWHYSKSTTGGTVFGSGVFFFDNGAKRPYLISCQDGDNIHFVASSAHPEIQTSDNISIHHFYFNMITETFHKTSGSEITDTLPFTHSETSLVASTSNNDTSWIEDISVKNGIPVILWTFYPQGIISETLIKHLYCAKYSGTAWENTFVDEVLSGYFGSEKSYPPASRFDATNPDIVWMPKQINEVTEIFKVNLNRHPIYKKQLTFASDVDNWRPISCASPKNNLLWLKNNSYLNFQNYDITLQSKTVQV